MKKIGLWGVGILFLVSGCAAPQKTPAREVRGIDYTAYQRPVVSAADDYTAAPLPAPSVWGEPAAAAAEPEAYTPSEDEDFTSEEIAASYGRYTDITVVAAAKRIKLGAGANSKHMALFQKALDAGYKKALRTYHPSGFTYSISSIGAVNPLSDIEVRCILDEQAANEVGQTTCNLFFQTLTEQYDTLLQEAKNNAAL